MRKKRTPLTQLYVVMGVQGLLPPLGRPVRSVSTLFTAFLEVVGVLQNVVTPVALLCKPVGQKTGLRKMFIFERTTYSFRL